MPTDIQIERETVISYNEAEPDALIWSASPSFQRRMAKLGVQPFKTGCRDHIISAWFKIPRTWVRIRPPSRRTLTPEQRKASVERARHLHLPPTTNPPTTNTDTDTDRDTD